MPPRLYIGLLWLGRHPHVVLGALLIGFALGLTWCDSEGYGPWRHA